MWGVGGGRILGAWAGNPVGPSGSPVLAVWQPSDLCSEKSAGLHTEQLTKGGQMGSLLCSPGSHSLVRHAGDKRNHLKYSSCRKPERPIGPQRSAGDSGQDEP